MTSFLSVPFPPLALGYTDDGSLALAVPLTIVWLGVGDQGWVVYVARWTPRGLGLQHVAGMDDDGVPELELLDMAISARTSPSVVDSVPRCFPAPSLLITRIQVCSSTV